MPVLRDIPLAMTAEEVLGPRRGRPSQPALLEAAEEVIALGHALCQPAAVYDWLEVQAVAAQQVRFSGPGGACALHVGPRADLLAPARRALVAVGTIGPALEARVLELNAAGQGLKSCLLDNVGVLAVGAVGEAVRCLAEEAAAQEGWGVGLALAPGSLVGWPLRDQRTLCALLPLHEVGLELNPQCVLVPHKSASWLIGMGPGYESHRVGSACKYCALAGSCWRRREDPA
jgi:hypothetical protein